MSSMINQFIKFITKPKKKKKDPYVEFIRREHELWRERRERMEKYRRKKIEERERIIYKMKRRQMFNEFKEELQEAAEMMSERIKYRPGGVGYYEAKEHFETCIKTQLK